MLKIVALLAAAAALIVPAAALGHANAKSLSGEVGPGFTIEVKAAGKDVKTLRPGAYTIKVQDKSSSHDFHLIGPGINKATTVAFTGTKTWKITLKKGTYTYQCDPHAAAGMKGTFKVK